jgi:hypothetical protein
MAKSARIFMCYSRADEALRDELGTHLAPLRRAGLISTWYDREIGAGAEWAEEIAQAMEQADIVLLLVSPNFMASNYIHEVELKRALERHKQRLVHVLPIILRPTELSFAEFKILQYLPRDGKPVTKWADRDEAWLDVVKGIKKVVASMAEGPKGTATQNQTQGTVGAGQGQAAPTGPKATAPTPVPLGMPTTASLRKALGKLLILDSDFEAFCLDYFPTVKTHFSSGMDRTTKVNLLLSLAERDLILRALQKHSPDFSKAEPLLEYE